MTRIFTARPASRGLRRDIGFFAGETVVFAVPDRPAGAALLVTVAADPDQAPLIQAEGQDSVVLGPVALALLPEGQTGCYNLWLRESGVQRLVQHGSLSAWASVAPDSQSAPLAVGPGTPRLIVDGDSVMANPGMRDLILSYLGDVTFAPEGYNQATGGHTVVDMLAGAQAVVDQIVPGETIVIVGPIGANREPGATVGDHAAQIPALYGLYLGAGAKVVAIPSLPDGTSDPNNPDPQGNNAYYAATAQITRDAAEANPSLVAVDITGFDGYSMKDDRTHPNVRLGAPFLAGRVRAAVLPLVAGSRLDSGANLLGAYGTLAGGAALSATGLSGIRPDGWTISRVYGQGSWTVSRDGAGDLVIAITASPDKGAVQLRCDVPRAALAGDVYDMVAELRVDQGSTGFGGTQGLTADGTLLGNLLTEAVASVPGHAIFPRARGVPLAADAATVPAILRLGVTQGGSVTYRLRRAGLFHVDNLANALSLAGTPQTVAEVGAAYSFVPAAAGGVPPYGFDLASGALPAGLTLDPGSGRISGTPTGEASQPGLALRVSDALGATAVLTPFTLTVIAAGAPRNTALPTVSGTAAAGQTLTASTGTWTGAPTGYGYQWRVSGNVQSGATAASFAVTAAQAGQTLSVEVLASNAAGSGAPARSAETAAVTVPGAVASWEPSLNHGSPAQLAFSDADRTVTATATIAGIRHGRGATAVTGKRYFEMVMAASVIRAGLVDGGVDALQGGSNGVNNVYWSGSYVFRPGGTTMMGTALTTGDVLQLAVDMTARRLWLRRNGSGLWNNAAGADPATGSGGIDIAALPATLYPYFALSNVVGAEAVLHGTAGRLLHPVPAGFQPLV